MSQISCVRAVRSPVQTVMKSVADTAYITRHFCSVMSQHEHDLWIMNISVKRIPDNFVLDIFMSIIGF